MSTNYEFKTETMADIANRITAKVWVEITESQAKEIVTLHNGVYTVHVTSKVEVGGLVGKLYAVHYKVYDLYHSYLLEMESEQADLGRDY